MDLVSGGLRGRQAALAILGGMTFVGEKEGNLWFAGIRGTGWPEMIPGGRSPRGLKMRRLPRRGEIHPRSDMKKRGSAMDRKTGDHTKPPRKDAYTKRPYDRRVLTLTGEGGKKTQRN